jgi:flagellar biosynthesis/type III secretory pathway protein FliH
LIDEYTKDWTKRWKEEGYQEGLQVGRQEGESAMVLRLSERRFGALDDGVRQQIQSADTDTLLVWSDRLLSAQRVEDIFGDTAPV